MTYLVNYQLNNTKNYSVLWDALRTYPQAKRVMQSLWIIQSPYTAREIRDHLSQFIDTDDFLLVTDITNAFSAWTNLELSNTEFKNLVG